MDNIESMFSKANVTKKEFQALVKIIEKIQEENILKKNFNSHNVGESLRIIMSQNSMGRKK